MPSSLAVIETTAAKVAADFEIAEFPFDPSVAAEKAGISIEARSELHGASGAIFLIDDPVIVHPMDMQGGLLNYTIGHELGHYFLSGHPEQILEDGGVHLSRGVPFASKKPVIEREADYFSACFLMPRKPTRQMLNFSDPGLEGVISLQRVAISSLTSSAIRAVHCDPYPIAMVMVGKNGSVRYSLRSDSFRSSVPGKNLSAGDCVPPDSAAFKISASEQTLAGAREEEESISRLWYGEGNKRLNVETFHLGHHGTLVILTGEENWEEDDEESDLIESWTPRFKR